MSGIRNTWTGVQQENPNAQFDNMSMSVDYERMADVLGGVAVPPNGGKGGPMTFTTAKNTWDSTTNPASSTLIAGFVLQWFSQLGDAGWYAAVSDIVKSENAKVIEQTVIEFDPEIPATLSDLVPVPIIHYTMRTQTHTYSMHGLGQVASWSQMYTGVGVQIFKEGQVTIGSCIIMHIQLLTHGAIWREQIETALIANITRIPMLADMAAQNNQSLGNYLPGVLCQNEHGWKILKSNVRNIMERMKKSYTDIVLPHEMIDLLNWAPPRNLERSRNPEMADALEKYGGDAFKKLNPNVWFDFTMPYRGRGKVGHYRPQQMNLVQGGYGGTDNAYIKSFSQSGYNKEDTGGTVILPPSTARFRDWRYLDLDGSVRFRNFAAVDCVRNMLCYDQTHPMLPLREDFYQLICDRYQKFCNTHGVTLIPGSNRGEVMIDPNIFFDINGRPRVVRYLGQTSEMYDKDFYNDAARIARKKIEARLGKGVLDSIDILPKFVLESKKNIKIPINDSPTDWGFEIFAWAVRNHESNKPGPEDGNEIKLGEFGVGELPDIATTEEVKGTRVPAHSICIKQGGEKLVVIIKKANFKATIEQGIRPTIEAVAFEDFNPATMHSFEAPTGGVPRGYGTYNHIKTFYHHAISGMIPGWLEIWDKDGKLSKLERLKTALEAYEEYHREMSEEGAFGVEEEYNEEFGNPCLNIKFLPPFLRIPEDVMTGISDAKLINSRSAMFETTIMDHVSQPTFVLRTENAADVVGRAGVLRASDEETTAFAVAYLSEYEDLAAKREFIESLPIFLGSIRLANATPEFLSDFRVGFKDLASRWSNIADLGKIDADIDADFWKFFIEQVSGLANKTDEQKDEEAQRLINMLNGVYNELDKAFTRGSAVPNITPQYLRNLASISAVGAGDYPRGSRSYDNFRRSTYDDARDDDRELVAYDNCKLCTDMVYYARAVPEKNQKVAFSAYTRPGNPHEAHLRPLAPLVSYEREAPSVEDIQTFVRGIELGSTRSTHKNILESYTNFHLYLDGAAAIARAQENPSKRRAAGSRRNNTHNVPDYDEYRLRELPAYMGNEALQIVSESPDMIRRLKKAAGIKDYILKSLCILFLFCRNHGMKQIQFIQSDWALWKGILGLFPFCHFKTLGGYFLNRKIIEHRYFLHDTALIVDGEHWMITMQERYMIASFVKAKARGMCFVAPHLAYLSVENGGGTRQICNTVLAYGNNNHTDLETSALDEAITAGTHFSISQPSKRHGDFFITDMGAAQTIAELPPMMCLSPRNVSGSATGYYGKSPICDTMIPAGIAFAIASCYEALAKRSAVAGTTNFATMKTTFMNDIVWRAPQEVPNTDGPGTKFVRGEGYWTNFEEGIGPSLNGQPVLFNQCNGATTQVIGVRHMGTAY